LGLLSVFSRRVHSVVAGLKEAKNVAGEGALRLIQDRLSDAEFGKNAANLST
jgi:KaiC/GvpD/RAD55 family RecA-like ATPase